MATKPKAKKSQIELDLYIANVTFKMFLLYLDRKNQGENFLWSHFPDMVSYVCKERYQPDTKVTSEELNFRLGYLGIVAKQYAELIMQDVPDVIKGSL